MRVVFQRVTKASVFVDGENVGEIQQGAVLLLGIRQGDTEAEADLLAKKCAETRVFSDDNDRLNLSVKDIHGGFLVIPNFTLYGNCRHGRRPDFTQAEKPDKANPLFEYFKNALKQNGVDIIQSGIFGADMKPVIYADGPITMVLDSAELMPQKKD